MRGGSGEGIWYDWIERPQAAASWHRPPALDRFSCDLWYGRLDLQLECLSPVHVSTGGYAVVDRELVKEMTRRTGTPIIPGSSVKGVVRSVIETVTGGCAPNNVRCQGSGGPCTACSLFGWVSKGGSHRGRVGFDDFVLAGEAGSALQVIRVPHMYSPRRRGPGRKVYLHRHQVERGPVPLEALRAGSILQGTAWLNGVSDDELSLLAFALGLDGTFALKVGGAKSAFLGSVRVSVTGQALRRGMTSVAVEDWPERADYASMRPHVQAAAQRLRRLWSWDEPVGRPWGGSQP